VKEEENWSRRCKKRGEEKINKKRYDVEESVGK
jgi:hypothetical protein